MKTCTVCGIEKTLDSFHVRPAGRLGRGASCKACKAEYHKKRWAAQPELREKAKVAARKSSMKKLGITQEQIDHFYKIQGGRCFICRITEEEHGKLLALDHNHENGKPRGLLCLQCNTGLGNFRDNVGLLSMAIAYLATTP